MTPTHGAAQQGGCGVKYDFKTAGDSAVAGDDCTATGDTVAFSSGEKEKNVGLDTLTVSEGDETFTLKLDYRTFTGCYHGDDVCVEEMLLNTGGFPNTMTLTGKIVDVATTSGS